MVQQNYFQIYIQQNFKFFNKIILCAWTCPRINHYLIRQFIIPSVSTISLIVNRVDTTITDQLYKKRELLSGTTFELYSCGLHVTAFCLFMSSLICCNKSVQLSSY